MSEENYHKHPDNCEACKGARGGVRGNENVIDGVILCDYCSVDYSMLEESQNPFNQNETGG